MKDVNYYELLGILSTSTSDDIKKAYHEKAKDWHPDTYKGNDASLKNHLERRFKTLQEAYKVLSDPIKRNEYDKTLGYVTNQVTTSSPIIPYEPNPLASSHQATRTRTTGQPVKTQNERSTRIESSNQIIKKDENPPTTSERYIQLVKDIMAHSGIHYQETYQNGTVQIYSHGRSDPGHISYNINGAYYMLKGNVKIDTFNGDCYLFIKGDGALLTSIPFPRSADISEQFAVKIENINTLMIEFMANSPFRSSNVARCVVFNAYLIPAN